MYAIIRDAKTLNGSITMFIRSQAKLRQKQHELAVSALIHASDSGNPAVLNRLFFAFSKNDQNSLRSYVGKIFLKDEGAYKYLSLTTKDGFAIINGKSKERKAFVEYAEQHLINPDTAKGDLPPFWQTDVKRETEEKVYYTSSVISKLKAILKEITPDDSKDGASKKLVYVHPKVKDLIETTLSKVETMAEQEEVAGPQPSKTELRAIAREFMPEVEDDEEPAPAKVTPRKVKTEVHATEH